MSEDAAALPAMPLSRLIRAYLSDAGFESLRLLRTPAFSMPILAMPLLFYSFFGVVLAGRATKMAEMANNLFVGWTVYGVMGPGLFGFGILVAVERNMGLLTFKRALPMPPGAYLCAKLIMAYVFAVVVMAMLVGWA
jgi:ABC-2 type transport system permease protein